MQYQFLNHDQIEQFLNQGYVVLHDCFSREVAEEWTGNAFARLGYSPTDATTWKLNRVHMPSVQRREFREFAPTAWGAACELLGGEQRVRQPSVVSDGFIINFHLGAGRPWRAPSPQSGGWHKDGDFFRHFL